MRWAACATRRRTAVGRGPGPGTGPRDGRVLFFADVASNTAARVRVDGMTDTREVSVGQEPIASFLMQGDRYGITLDQGGRTATALARAGSFQ